MNITIPPVNTINNFPVGILNCYECEFPSLYKYLATKGAKLIVGPTAADYHFRLANGSRTQVAYQDATKHIIPGMAAVFRMFVAYSNRRGWENVIEGSWEYQGNSGIWGPEGETFLKADLADKNVDLLLIGDCIPNNHLPFSPEGNHLTDDRIQQVEKLLPGR